MGCCTSWNKYTQSQDMTEERKRWGLSISSWWNCSVVGVWRCGMHPWSFKKQVPPRPEDTHPRLAQTESHLKWANLWRAHWDTTRMQKKQGANMCHLLFFFTFICFQPPHPEFGDPDCNFRLRQSSPHSAIRHIVDIRNMCCLLTKGWMLFSYPFPPPSQLTPFPHA